MVNHQIMVIALAICAILRSCKITCQPTRPSTYSAEEETSHDRTRSEGLVFINLPPYQLPSQSRQLGRLLQSKKIVGCAYCVVLKIGGLHSVPV